MKALATMAAVLAAPALLSPAAAGSPLKPQRLYNGVGKPLVVTAEVPRGAAATVALLDAGGKVIAPPRNLQPGEVDLGELLPAVWSLTEAAYAQCEVAGRPFGSALVVQPMLSRLPPRTETARRADGTPYTRIVGWGEEPSAEDRGPGPQRTFSGLRVYPERDVVLHTTRGDIRLAMRPDEAPNTVWNFLHLVEGGFYDGLTFHRIVPLTRDGEPFVIQGGDPTGAGDGGPGYWLPIEPSALPHDFGVISMARSDDPDSAGSQFFICLSRAGTSRLDGQYCSFGYAVDGAAAIQDIAGVVLADVATGRPVRPPVVQRAELVPAPSRIPGRGRPDRRVERIEPAVQPQPDRKPR